MVNMDKFKAQSIWVDIICKKFNQELQWDLTGQLYLIGQAAFHWVHFITFINHYKDLLYDP